MSGTPGPNNAMVAASGATFGFTRTVPHLLGVAVGFPAMLLVVALGAGDVMRAAPPLHEILRWVGAAYLLWLAFKIATARPSAAGTRAVRARPLTFLQAALFQWVNPKAWIIALGAIATYTTSSNITVQAVVLAAIFMAVTVPTLAFWTMTGVGAARVLRTGRGLRAFNLAMAALLVASLVPLLREG
ncbi:MAG: LysE family translocator [Acetobacteraceae bacterium]|nr:LysE family translocator [Acetobacteraceae bacterium]